MCPRRFADGSKSCVSKADQKTTLDLTVGAAMTLNTMHRRRRVNVRSSACGRPARPREPGYLHRVFDAYAPRELDHQARQVAIFVTATVVTPGDPVAETGRSKSPPVSRMNPEDYRQGLAAALDPPCNAT